MPKEYIEREEAVKKISGGESMKSIAESDADERFVEVLKRIPAADVVEVVYCKECKHLYCCSAIDREFYCRHIHGMKGALNPIEENPYCSYGERKDCADK